jgi:hypothetical protein
MLFIAIPFLLRYQHQIVLLTQGIEQGATLLFQGNGNFALAIALSQWRHPIEDELNRYAESAFGLNGSGKLGSDGVYPR